MSSKLISSEQVAEIYKGQLAVNSKAGGENWKEKQLPFFVAACTELGEALAYLENEWNWWKKVPPASKGQIWLEIIDAFHFTISDHLEVITPVQMSHMINQGYLASIQMAVSGKQLPSKASAICNMMSSIFRNDIEDIYFGYGILCNLFELSPLDIFKWYCAKNALNKLRQDHGYKEGKYIKNWEPDKQDNEFLEEILNVVGEEFSIESIKADLEKVYLDKIKDYGNGQVWSKGY